MGEVKFLSGLPKIEGRSCLVIYDRKLLRHSEAKAWINKFEKSLAVTAGEELKNLDHFPSYVKKILNLVGQASVKDTTLVAVGGGSVGDFVGFLASVLKRGVNLIHIPTTWLSAIDSAHGGKTALNVGNYKNQIGSFYPAQEVLISKKLLSMLPEKELKSAYGELFKVALINGGDLAKQVLELKSLDAASMWRLLPDAVKAKMKIVKSDPFEKKKIRYFLNLGHSFGHALELEHKLPHGEAVLYGTFFALKWSLRKKLLSQRDYEKLTQGALFKPKTKKKLNANTLKKVLLQDKKSAGDSKLNFVFLEKPGKCRVKKVSLNDLVDEAKNQGWV
jgi:3-dehydroquinate synthase